MAYFDNVRQTLSVVLSSAVSDSESAAAVLLSRYGSPARIFAADVARLAEIKELGVAGALSVKLAAALITRSKTDGYKFGVRHTADETDDYFKSLLMPCSVEVVYVMSFDKEGRAISADLVSSGVVNASEFLPRKVAEIATKRKACYIVMAHNHPLGECKFSDEDMVSAVHIAQILLSVGIKLVRHIVVSGTSSLSEVLNTDANMTTKIVKNGEIRYEGI